MCSGQFGMKGVVFFEFAGQEPIGQPKLFRRAPRGDGIGETLATVRAGALADPDQAGIRSRAQLGIEATERNPQSASGCPLRRVRRNVKLAQEAKELVFRVWVGGRFGQCHDPLFKECSRLNALHSSQAQKRKNHGFFVELVNVTGKTRGIPAGALKRNHPGSRAKGMLFCTIQRLENRRAKRRAWRQFRSFLSWWSVAAQQLHGHFRD